MGMHLFIDVDGTLLNSFPGIASTIESTFTELGLPMPSAAQLSRVPGPPLIDTFRAWQLPHPEKALAVYRRRYLAEGWAQAELFPGWAEALPRWRAEGLGLCTATSKGDAVTAQMLERVGVAQYFDFIGGADDAGGTRPTKRHVIEWVLDSMDLRGRENEILMIGDRSHDYEGARPLCIRTALVGWGHGTDEECAAADFFCADFAELDALVHSLRDG